MKCRFVCTASLFFGMVLTAAAQTASLPSLPDGPSAPSHVAVVAFQIAVAQCNEGQRAYVELRAKYASREAHLQALDDQITALTKELSAGSKLPALQRAKLSREIDAKKKQLDADAAAMHKDANKDIQNTFDGISAKIYKVLDSYVREKGYTQVFDTSSKESPFVLYANPSIDITKPLIALYNEKSGIPAPPKSAVGSGAKPTTVKPAATHPAAH